LVRGELEINTLNACCRVNYVLHNETLGAP